MKAGARRAERFPRVFAATSLDVNGAETGAEERPRPLVVTSLVQGSRVDQIDRT